ncbi:hypothetical protein [Edaphobacter bradus]|uniref:hypothetical protein n=1 Tax=Edaphobacter bradus TaxID=2259016 RepID=UPI0021DFFCE2|nr:hypothetical protein [Edaphobacter bradus]
MPNRTTNLFSATLLAAAALLLASGCNSKVKPTPENFTAALNAWFLDHPDCLLSNTRFPYETSDSAEIKRLDTLVKSQLLESHQEASIHVTRYTVSTAGTRYAPRFCYGHRVISSIDSSTPPAVVNGFPQTQVNYHYTMQDVPIWAKSADVQQAFPSLATAASGQATGQSALAQTMAGWQVPD